VFDLVFISDQRVSNMEMVKVEPQVVEVHCWTWFVSFVEVAVECRALPVLLPQNRREPVEKFDIVDLLEA